MLCDGKSAHQPAPGYESIRFLPVSGDEATTPDTLSDWNERVSSVSQATVTLRSFDFTKPQNPVEAVAKGAGQHPGDALEVYEYLGDFTEQAEGEARGRRGWPPVGPHAGSTPAAATCWVWPAEACSR